MLKDLDIELLSALFETNEPTSTADLARIVGCPRTTVSDYMLSLEKEGIVVDIGGKNNLRKWVITKKFRQKFGSKLEFGEDEISDVLETLVERGEVEKQIIGGEAAYRCKIR